MLIEKELFDNWAAKYENDIHNLKSTYPFAGYFEVIDYLRLLISEKKTKILDLGTGTGLMLDKVTKGNDLTYLGCDFSPEMIKFASKRLIADQLFVHDIREDLIPGFLADNTFDLIYSAYTFHHFNTPLKIEILKNYFQLLKPNGRFVLADISFDNEAALSTVKNQEGKRWDSDEDKGYFRKDSFMKNLNDNGFEADYSKISYCAGIYDIRLKI